MERIKKYEPLWGKWMVKRIIGEGSFGAVYEVENEKFGNRSSCAVKLISFKNTEMLQGIVEGETLSSEKLEKLKLEEARKNVREAVLMEKLQGRDHIVTIYDYDIFPGDRTTDIIIRMELLTNLNDYMKVHTTDSEDNLKKIVINLGIDIAKALEECEKEKIVHRDIKPDNIFINKNDTFKLGDFGLSRKMNKSAAFSLRKSAGTPFYMAPESLGWANRTDYQSDIYSLGMVMYQLLNDGKIPFVKSMKNFSEIDDAIERRADGEELQPPKYDEGELWKVIQKACRFKKEERYQKASEMRRDLERLKNKWIEKAEKQVKKEIDSDNQGEKELLGREKEEKQTKKEPMKPKKEQLIVEKSVESESAVPKEKEKKNKKTILPVIGMVALLGVAGISISMFNNSGKSNTTSSGDSKQVETTVASTPEQTKANMTDVSAQVKIKEFYNAKAAATNGESKFKVGDIIQFGKYPQDKAQQKKSIDWLIVRKTGNKALLLSKYILDAHAYHEKNAYITWEDSDIRNWLNEKFYMEAFDSDEQKKILSTLLTTDDGSDYSSGGAYDTTDKVFLLSKDEVEGFFPAEKARIAKTTQYTLLTLNVYNGIGGFWWMRSPLTRSIYGSAAPQVGYEGGTDNTYPITNISDGGVRPAICINLD